MFRAVMRRIILFISIIKEVLGDYQYAEKCQIACCMFHTSEFHYSCEIHPLLDGQRCVGYKVRFYILDWKNITMCEQPSSIQMYFVQVETTVRCINRR